MTQQVAIVIVTFNSQNHISACLESLRSFRSDLVVIDNYSSDGTVDTVLKLGFNVIRNPKNRGFAAAVNQGVTATHSPYVLLLNPDAVLQTGIHALVTQCEQPGTAASAGQLVSAEGQPQRGFNVRRFPTPLALFFETVLINRLWPGNPVNWRYRCLDLDLTKSSEVEQPAGAFLMFRRDVWLQVNGFDESFYPVWFEDVDFCKRVRDAGFRLQYSPEAVALHTGGHSVSRIELGKRTEYWYRSVLLYSVKHFNPAGRILACLGVIIGSILRFSFGGADHRTRAMLRSYGRVVKVAFQSIWMNKVPYGDSLFASVLR